MLAFCDRSSPSFFWRAIFLWKGDILVAFGNSDITANAKAGAGGQVEIDPSYTLIDLPESPIEVTALFDLNACSNFFYNGEFYFVGRGGIPPSPFRETIPYARTIDRLWIPTDRETLISETIGWERDESGNVVALLGETVPHRNRCNES